jgi:hypothetical protein
MSLKQKSLGKGLAPEPDRRELTLTWLVREDLCSERYLDYRQLIMDALHEYQCSSDCTAERHMMIDRMKWDHLDGDLAELHAVRLVLKALLNTESQLNTFGHIEVAVRNIELALSQHNID